MSRSIFSAAHFNDEVEATLATSENVLKGLLLWFVEKDGDQDRAIDDNHRALRSSMMSCGDRW